MSRARGSARLRSRRRGRLRLALTLAVIVGLIAGIALTARGGPEPLPLADDGIIVAQAHEKHLDPALIAAVIDAETKFVPRESSAGAQGLMQVLPSTAQYLAARTGGKDARAADLSNPSVNIAYGSYYLRYLLDHYEQAVLPAIAAYNAGLTNVDLWAAKAKAQGRKLSVAEIPFAQTRAYVRRVLSAEVIYRRTYRSQLGLGSS